MLEFEKLSGIFVEGAADKRKFKEEDSYSGYVLGAEASVSIDIYDDNADCDKQFLGDGYRDAELESCAVEGGTFARNFMKDTLDL